MRFTAIMYLLPLILLFVNCKSGRDYKEIEFQNIYKLDAAIQEKLAKDTTVWKNQISAAEYAKKGDFKNALAQWDIAFPGRATNISEKQIDSIRDKYEIIPAVNYIVEQAKTKQVVIINEAHHNPFHRKFTKSLLLKLYKNGYQNIGLEALTNGKNKDSLLHKRGYPIRKSGYYIKEPQFGNLVRTALEIGFTVFSYEQTARLNGKEREIAQAKNIEGFINKNPNEKFIIHCGYDHVLEGRHKKWGKAMAARLAEYTDLDPLTINQTKYSERSKNAYNNLFLKALNLKESSVLLDENKEVLGYKRNKSYTDIAVLHPVTKYKNNRPTWLFDAENKAVKIELKDAEISFPVMVLAYVKGENIHKAIPTDIIEIPTKKAFGYLALKPGNYTIVISNKTKKALQFELEVK